MTQFQQNKWHGERGRVTDIKPTTAVRAPYIDPD